MESEAKNLTSPCCNAGLRADVAQTIDIEIDAETGELEAGFDFSESEVKSESVYCEGCGEALKLVFEGSGKDYTLKKRNG